MQIGVIGLGRMGGNIRLRLMRAQHHCVVYDHSQDAVKKIADQGAAGATNLEDMVKQLAKPRAIWVMLPSAKITEDTIGQLAGMMEAGDTIIDGGNTFYKDDIRRAAELSQEGHHLCRCRHLGRRLGPRTRLLHDDRRRQGSGRSPRSYSRGTCAWRWDDRPRPRTARAAIPVWKTATCIAARPAPGHFVKMVHNGIEYGLMQAYAEGFDIIHHKDSTELPENERFTIDMADVAEVWRRGSVISSVAARPNIVRIGREP